MALEGCYKIIKYLMFAFNVLFWLAGCLILAIGIWIRVDENTQDAVKAIGKNDLFNGAYILIAVGGATMIIGFLGCLGAIKESQWMLGTFFVLLFVILGILVAAGIYIILTKHLLQETLSRKLRDNVDKYSSDPTVMDEMDALQRAFNCCGNIGSSDYSSSEKPVPQSCRGHENNGCTSVITAVMSNYIAVVAGIAIAIGLIMLLGMIFSMLLCCAIRGGTRRSDYVEKYN